MQDAGDLTVFPDDVYAVTDKGKRELNRGSTTLTAMELEILVLLDSKTTAQEILNRTPNLEEHHLGALIPKLVREGYAMKASIEVQDDLDFRYFFDAEKTMPTAEMMQQAEKEADTGAPTLLQEGYYVSITRQNSELPKRAAGAKISVLAIEDDPHISAMVMHVLTKEGYEARKAANRAEVLAALRHLPSPDLVLLDVNLPDANGFEILERMKQHPVLKKIPVIMLTGNATRESVSRGLADGADGYITKPFDVAILRKGIKYVLGLDTP